MTHSPIPFPNLEPLTITLEGHEVTAIVDALTTYDLLASGLLAGAKDMVSKRNDGGYTDMTLKAQAAVREKIEKAQAPQLAAVREWMERMRAHQEEPNG